MTALVDVLTYQRLTGDTTSATALVEQSLDDAVDYVEGQCRRTLEFGTYTETLDRFSNGCVYPHAVPVASVSDPPTAEVRLGGIYLGAWVGGWPDTLLPLPPQGTVTYEGGYQPYGSGLTPEIPIRLVRVLCRIAYLALHPSSLIGQGVPANAKAASVGDVSISGDLSGLLITDPSIERDLKRFTRRTAVQRSPMGLPL